MPQSPIEQEVAQLIVEVLQLEIEPIGIDPEAPLFNTGLGLDSIDALELALAISQRYGIELREEEARNEMIFTSLQTLAGFIDTHRK